MWFTFSLIPVHYDSLSVQSPDFSSVDVPFSITLLSSKMCDPDCPYDWLVPNRSSAIVMLLYGVWLPTPSAFWFDSSLVVSGPVFGESMDGFSGCIQKRELCLTSSQQQFGLLDYVTMWPICPQNTVSFHNVPFSPCENVFSRRHTSHRRHQWFLNSPSRELHFMFAVCDPSVVEGYVYGIAHPYLWDSVMSPGLAFWCWLDYEILQAVWITVWDTSFIG